MHRAMRYIDRQLNNLTMYRVVLYLLIILALVAIIFGFTGTLAYSGWSLLLSLVVLVTACWLVNTLLAKLYGVTTNNESAYISGLILFFIFSPATTLPVALALALTGVITMASKYIIAIRGRHIFNPVAIGAVIVGLAGLAQATWWVATAVMLPFVVIATLLIVRKIHRGAMAGLFLLIAASIITLTNLLSDVPLPTAFTDSFLVWPIVFLAGVMLTEPLTTPPTRRWRYVYAAIVGVLVGIGGRLHVGDVYLTPELAIVIGNLAVYASVLKARVPLTLLRKQQIAPGIYEFHFQPGYRLSFTPGQYLDVTLPLQKDDGRGNRRSFSIASSPTESDIIFGVRFFEPSSAFKASLAALKPDQAMYAVQRSGDFVLPKRQSEKMVFIAGGIGITPFRSMLQYLIDTNQTRDIILFYQVADASLVVFQDVIKWAEGHGLKTVYVATQKEVPVSWQGEQGIITPEMIKQHVPDWQERTCYISGPPAMVDSYKVMLRQQGVSRKRIVTDYFSGY